MKLNLKHSFDAAHRLEFHKGQCKNLHGHRWNVEIEIGVEKLEDKMIIDFGELKTIINEFDHATLLKDCDENSELISVLFSLRNKTIILKDTPTAENLAKEIHQKIRRRLNLLEILFCDLKVVIWESPNASIEYCG